MKVVVQRVESSSVLVDDKIVGQINKGLMILVGFTYGDNIDTIKYMVNKIVNLRIFDDENGVMNLSVNDIKGEEATKLYDLFNDELRKSSLKIETGIF